MRWRGGDESAKSDAIRRFVYRSKCKGDGAMAVRQVSGGVMSVNENFQFTPALAASEFHVSVISDSKVWRKLLLCEKIRCSRTSQARTFRELRWATMPDLCQASRNTKTRCMEGNLQSFADGMHPGDGAVMVCPYLVVISLTSKHPVSQPTTRNLLPNPFDDPFSFSNANAEQYLPCVRPHVPLNL